ncbi:copper amine oxidase N-terminal domain-containing protein [Paenibacillus sp. M1]|uniref:Copper amine oxidase N-terminal domain-containing protein n=1 Tax=Paenibacillus haidiansis TaxID=1574488 RepID=A0ABU7VTG2_9BACL
MKRLKWLALPLALMLVVLAGCQAVAGFDINKALVQSLTLTSGESKQTLSIELVPAPGASAEDLEIIKLINSFSLTVDSGKTQDATHASIKGAVGFNGEKLPFHLSMDDEGMAVLVDGAKQPIYIPLDYAEEGVPNMDAYMEDIQKFSTQAGEFFIKHLPNPNKISVKKVTEPVNGESVNLTNLQVELNGEELLNLVKPFLTNVAGDEEGIKTVVGAFYDAIYPIISSEFATDFEGEDALGTLAESKPVAVAAISAAIKSELDGFLAKYDQSLAELKAELPELETVLGKDTVLKLNLYFDGNQNIRKENMELTVALPADEDLPIQAVKLRTDSELWNVGGKVDIDEVDTSAGVLDLTDENVTPGQVLRSFKSDSQLYKWLKDDLQITYKYVLLDPYNDYYDVISKDNTSFVPLRYVSEELDAEIKWTQGSKQIVIIDDITGGQIVVTQGSKQASVNGSPVTLAQPVFVHEDGTTYVPLRFIAESLGATVSVDEDGWITIERQ